MDIQTYLEDGMAAADRILRCREGTPDDTEKEILAACVWGALRAWARENGTGGGGAAAVMERVLVRRLGCSPEESARQRLFLQKCTPESDPFLDAVIRGGEALRAAGADDAVTAAFLRPVTALARREREKS